MNAIIQAMDVFYNVYFFFLISIVLLLIPLIFYSDFENKYARSYDNMLSGYIVLGSIALFGLRGWDIGTDTAHYVKMFFKMSNFSQLSNAINHGPLAPKDPGFSLLLFYAEKYLNLRIFFIMVATLFVIPLYIAIRRMATINRSVMLFGFACFYYFPLLGINVIRQGLCLSFVILAFTILKNWSLKNFLIFLLLVLIGLSFHISGVIVVVFYFIARLIRINSLYYVVLAITAVLARMSLGLVNLPIIGPMIALNDRIDAYSAGLGTQPPSGLQLSKIVYHSAVFFWAYYNLNKLNDSFYNHIFRLFIALTSFYFLCLNMSYSDRFGVLSWILTPILIGYPMVNYKGIVSKPSLSLTGQYFIFMTYSAYVFILLRPYLK